MQEFHVILEQFCHANLTTSYFLNTDHKQWFCWNPKSGEALNWSGVSEAEGEERKRQRALLHPPCSIIVTSPKPASLHGLEIKTYSSFSCSFRMKCPSNYSLFLNNKLLEESKGKEFWSLATQVLVAPPHLLGCILLYTVCNYCLVSGQPANTIGNRFTYF